jgi:probable F420-dependent oxidoreductase
VKLGLITPVVTLNPRVHNSWEEAADFDAVVAIAEAADRLGYSHITCSEHVAVPTEAVERRGGRYWDPLAVFGYLAARTEQVRFATHVLVLGYHHPLELAKRYGTLDRVTGGRLILGVGVGSLVEEFELLGVPFADRGARGDDALAALRASLSTRQPVYHGAFYDFEGFVVDPCALQERVPIWIGGRTARSLRRAVELAEAWVPFGVKPQEAAAWLAKARDTEAWAARAEPLEIGLFPEPALDPLGAPDQARRQVAEAVDAGATFLNLRLIHTSLPHCLEQLEAMVELAP